jgi:Uma2 family endonuclease
MSVQLARRLFTVEEYHQMTQAGIFTEDERVELIDGEVVEMTPIGSRHAACVRRLLNQLFSLQVSGCALLSIQDPIRVGEHSEPQPDVALLRSRQDFYASAHPTPQDILLLVEVADSSLEYDQEIKVPLYARAGIPEVWLVNLPEDRVLVYRRPAAQGYQEMHQVRREEGLAPESFPDLIVSVNEILG